MSSRPRLRSWTSGSAAAPRRGRLATAMDFLRIRQKARERSAERDRHVGQGGAAPGTPPAGADQPAAVIRAVAAGGPVAPVEAGAAGARAAADARPAAPAAPPPRPLDALLADFFWREGEVAPALPDLVSAAAVPAVREPVEARHEWLT